MFNLKSLFIALLLAAALWGVMPAIGQAQGSDGGALNLWSDLFSQEGVGFNALLDIGLGTKDPRVIAAGVVRVILGFLGVIALLLIIYGGWLWTMSKGDAVKIDIAQKIIRSAAIGLLIVLAAFALSLYITRVLLGVTGASNAQLVGSGCESGAVKNCGCGGLQSCAGGTWGACVGSDCSGGGGGGRQYCDSNLMSPQCDADSQLCPVGQFCSEADGCRCQRGGGYGQSCAVTGEAATCSSSLCGAYLTCDEAKGCLCLGAPVIVSVSPSGGFCDGSPDTACLIDEDCNGFQPSSCNTDIPNGAAGNLLTIKGSYFQAYQAGVSQVLIGGVEAPLASTVNSNCLNSWSDTQIIVTVPAGVTGGPITVTAANGSDITSNDRGPKIKDFKANQLNRPGLCALSKDSGLLNDPIEYFGFNLLGVNAFFGSYRQNVMAGQSNFNASQGSATVPNVNSGSVGTFVIKENKAFSNSLIFNKLTDPAGGPIVSSVEPMQGAPGQYVTIRGTGFGMSRGASAVMFDDQEAVYDFPPVCADNLWSDNQILVKVPAVKNGEQTIIVKVGEQTAVSGQKFSVNDQLALSPGLCKLEKGVSKVGDQINVWGENFGNQNSDSRLVFFNEILALGGEKICWGGDDDGQLCVDKSNCSSGNCSNRLAFWGKDNKMIGSAKPDKAVTKVPVGAITGPLKLAKGKPPVYSNPLNLVIGECSTDSQCGGGVCCEAGTPLAGSCQSDMQACYGSSQSCVFEWGFDTSASQQCPTTKPFACSDGSCCSKECVLDEVSGQTKCREADSCFGIAAAQCLANTFCPNSPGQCSVGEARDVSGGSCDCSILGFAGAEYDATGNRCVLPDRQCSAAKNISGFTKQAYCAVYQGEPRWQISTPQTCSSGFTKAANNQSLCVKLDEICSLCPQKFNCQAVGEGIGKCVSPLPVCGNGFNCQAGVCRKNVAASCECCCDKNNNQNDGSNPACCAPLTCANSCGSSPDLGLCSGCAEVGSTQAEHDAACNCSGTSGKFCDTSVPGGVCRDCQQVASPQACSEHATCCVDGNNGNACRAATASLVFEDNFAYCAYYQCADDCATPAKTGKYDNQTVCEGACDSEPTCDGSILPGCQMQANACPPDKPVCGSDCVCREDGNKPGDPCADERGACGLFCGNVYACRGKLGCQGLGCLGQPDESTCRCCCDPNNQSKDPAASDFDKCAAVGSGKLSCRANVEPCDGEQRGLCCGCSDDVDCGSVDNVGCGSDACCHPKLTVTDMWPQPNSEDVCRNTLITAEFNGLIDSNTAAANVLLVGDYGDKECPQDSRLLSTSVVEQPSGFAAWLQKLKHYWLSLFSQEVSAAERVSNFCQVSGAVSTFDLSDGLGKKQSTIAFRLTKPLQANIRYFLIIKGDAALNSQSGLLSKFRVGLSGVNLTDTDSFNGLVYGRGQIWSFTAGDEICLFDQVTVDPAQHLFRQPEETYVYQAEARDDDGRPLSPVEGYAWRWQWSSDDPQTARVDKLTEDQSNLGIVTAGRKGDAHTFIWAQALMTADELSPLSTVGQIKQGKARAIVFLCANPWPTITDTNAWPLVWTDAVDNCDVCTDPLSGKTRACQPEDCLDNKFSLYYCRDQGAASQQDDLPGLNQDLTVRGRYRYYRQDEWKEVLKDYYLFRSQLPQPPKDLSVELTAAASGQEIGLSWSGSADVYRVYYGESAKHYQASIETKNKNLTINNLKNGQVYYFAVSAVDDFGIESNYSSEVSVKVEDKIAPPTPQNFKATVNFNASEYSVKAQWSANKSVTYKLGYGPLVTLAVQLPLANRDTYVINKLNNLSAQDYYINLIAQDSYGNQSEPAVLLCAKGCQSSCACVKPQ